MFATYVPASVVPPIFAIYLKPNVVVLVDEFPVASVAEVVAVASYPYDVSAENVASTDAPVPPVEVARIPNCSVPTVDDAAVAPIAVIVLEAFCCDVSVCPRREIVYPEGAFVAIVSVCAMVSALSPEELVEDAYLTESELRLPK
jgi:hypothetical protein